MEREIDAVLTPSDWEITLPYELATAGPQNLALLASFTALGILDVPLPCDFATS